MTAGRRPVVAVVGAGIAGLAAAWELARGDVGGGVVPEVHVLDADDRFGGALRAAVFAGRSVDLAADAFVARRPEATDLCAELGLTEELVPVGAAGAAVWARGRLRPLPDGLNLGVPTRWWPLARSGILDPVESLSAARDLVRPHIGARGVVGDGAVGAIVEARLGRPVVERLVDPLIGGINAGDVDDLSAAAVFPYLLAASIQPGSLMRGLGRDLRRRGADAGRGADPGPGATRSPVFWSLRTGTAGLAERLSAELERCGVVMRAGVSVDATERQTHPDQNGVEGGRWRLHLRTDRNEVLDADGVVLAVPAGVAAGLLAEQAPEPAGLLRTIDYASVAVLTIALPAAGITSPLFGTGFLVPRTTTLDGARPLATGVTYLGRKWPHLARPGDELIRVSVGRFGDERHQALDDDELLEVVLTELSQLLGVTSPPLATKVTRFDRAFPQYRVGHLIKVARIEQGVTALGGIEVAGAAYRGVGIPACIGTGREAARRLLGFLSTPRPPTALPVRGEGQGS